MANKKPATIAEYIDAAPVDGKTHLEALYDLLKQVAPQADETIKWGQPFFVEPRFLFAFSAHKNHMGFTSSNAALDGFRDALEGYEITKMGIVKVPYNKPVPAAVIRKIAKAQIKLVKARKDDNFWP